MSEFQNAITPYKSNVPCSFKVYEKYCLNCKHCTECEREEIIEVNDMNDFLDKVDVVVERYYDGNKLVNEYYLKKQFTFAYYYEPFCICGNQNRRYCNCVLKNRTVQIISKDIL